MPACSGQTAPPAQLIAFEMVMHYPKAHFFYYPPHIIRAMGIFRKPKKTVHAVEVKWGEHGKGNVFVNGKKHGYVSFSGSDPLMGLDVKPLKAKSPVEVAVLHPFTGKDEGLKRQGIGTEVHEQLEEEIRRVHPDADALVALVHQEDLRIDSYEAAKAAIKFYEGVGYRLHQKVAVKDGLGDNPAFRGEFRYPISYVYVMVKKLR